jgi:FkbM family methyltransferase
VRNELSASGHMWQRAVDYGRDKGIGLFDQCVFGRRALLPLFRRVRHFALLVENFGVAEVKDSGEQNVLRRLRDRHRVDAPLVFDVGANRGAYVDLIFEHLPDAHVHAFEPNPAIYSELQKRFEGNARVSCQPIALGAHSRRADLYGVTHASPDSHLTGLSSLTQRDPRSVGHEMDIIAEVEVMTVDAYCKANGISMIDLLKLDVEGHELDVLVGAADLLKRGGVHAVQFEFGGANLDTRTYLRDFIRLLGAEFEVFRVLRDGLVPLTYSEREEIFVTSNYYTERR